jgi:hypothetical protein
LHEINCPSNQRRREGDTGGLEVRFDLAGVVAGDAGLLELAADDLVDPEGGEAKADGAEPALLRLVEDMRKVVRLQAAGADAEIPAAPEQQETETRVWDKHGNGVCRSQNVWKTNGLFGSDPISGS